MDMAPDYGLVYFNLGTAYVIKGKYEEAIEFAKKSVELSGGSPFMKAGLAFAYARSGKKEEALEIRDELIKLANSGYMLHGSLAIVYIALSDKDNAIKCIEKAFHNKEVISFARPLIENYLGSNLLSNDPRFIQIQKKIGLE
jgi:tetratricopeptide (TPR) repeat protein